MLCSPVINNHVNNSSECQKKIPLNQIICNLSPKLLAGYLFDTILFSLVYALIIRHNLLSVQG